VENSLKKARKELKWITPTRAALQRERIVVCGDCWRTIT
jgi:hypothetical protein